MGFMEGLAARSDLAAMQGYNSKAYRASFERPVPVAVNGGGFGMGAGAYSGYGVSYNNVSGGGAAYANQGSAGPRLLNGWGTNGQPGYYGDFTGTRKTISEYLGLGLLGATVFGALDAAVTGTGYNPNDQYAGNSGAAGRGQFHDGFYNQVGGMTLAPRNVGMGYGGGGTDTRPYAIQQVAARQMASAQAGMVDPRTAMTRLTLNADISSSQEDYEKLKEAIDKYNEANLEKGDFVELVPNANGKAALVYSGINAQINFGKGDPVLKDLVQKLKSSGSKPATAPTIATTAITDKQKDYNNLVAQLDLLKDSDRDINYVHSRYYDDLDSEQQTQFKAKLTELISKNPSNVTALKKLSEKIQVETAA